MAADDPFLWLEDVEGEKALDWARAQNERALARLEAHPDFAAIHARNLEILTSDERIAMPALRGGQVYNFWRDAEHVRGLWRRTSLENYRADPPEWQVLLDLDRLAEAEDRNWVWAGSSCRYPDYDRCLVGLSVGGADAAVRREFDLDRGEFVADGFYLPESKSSIGWRDRDSVFLGPVFDDTQVTDSGYPRLVQIWERGTPKEDARTIFTGERADVGSFGGRYWDGDRHYDIVIRVPDTFSRIYHLLVEGETRQLNIPRDANIAAIQDGQLLLELKSDWQLGERTFPQGALVAGPVEGFLAERPEVSLMFAPDARSSITAVSKTENVVLVSVLENVVGKLLRFVHDDAGWHREEIEVPALGTVSLVATDDRSDVFFYTYAGFLTPTSLYQADAATGASAPLRNEPAWFDPAGMSVRQHEAISADGERIPYFVVTPPGFEADGKNPTMIFAYGGFEVPYLPGYSPVTGSAWLERGGVYVLANIRGGGEFGPRWHQAALKENRQRAFDDLIAVAEDLIERKITSPEHLGIRGGSNGGLLVGAVMVQRPELFNAVVSQVPLLDMRRYHRLLAGASWMAEYGDPDDPEQWAYISRYSPYQNVSADADYPVAFFATSTRDDRVHPAHARKMVAKMLDQGHEVLYYENIEGGHGGAANLEQSAYLNALIFAYLFERLAPAEAAD
ncbi:prolyl oligopeptidase family serine peptidase [Wenzhouxiangella sp. XN24]|uniref:prolyl oligopeptidase family serine peptidase n=1 Tax=Wenzhouxiangella sp. XN24 TaxID=2713569 RepID=UPI00197DE711|nr:prolyl oligopeptidase family serine peptidase [Wenzhouxiangella sp. XN24]